MAIKPIRRMPSKPATPKTMATTTSSRKPLPTVDVEPTEVKRSTRRPVAPPKKAVTPVTPVTPVVAETPVVEPPKAKEPATPAGTQPRVPRRRPVAPPAPKKEVVVDGTEKAEQSETGASEEASKPVVTSESPSVQTKPRPAVTGKEFEASNKLSEKEMRAMTIEERSSHFRMLNKHSSERFIALRKELPKKMAMRKDEAIERKIIGAKPRTKSGLTVHYCPYCVDWQPYHVHGWSGYTKCCGCSISTKDFYTRADNELFNKE